MKTELCLFVYGTLMRDQPAFHRLAASSTRAMRAQLPNALLYSVGPYPIAVDSNGEQGHWTVHGEVHWLVSDDLLTLLQQLDAYEGDEYTRVQRPVTLTTGEVIVAWVYLGEQPYAAQYQPIPSGDWRKRADGC